LPGQVTRLEIISGNHQRAFVNAAYPEPWVVRALGDDGLPVPYASLIAQVPNTPGEAGASFGARIAFGFETIYPIADANGIATVPRFTANSTPGVAVGLVGHWNEGLPVEFDFENLPLP